eukprot:CAMPEP_0202900246 /NCGR_PEP_ID=MMETSP1392-20130828/10580_1 /ASSEMBLY_ACC=CAM_ASM_000868 /TAXON_ID=225041 /ORGANISM="Chlamydomonas chlamydogama, Strain SAG 11-48b" /LENGTH=151 /DNA_ID=CAMNT_0049586595 /DNA_START=595 /DNA_END=1050 /DNA_ORIENTATION=-
MVGRPMILRSEASSGFSSTSILSTLTLSPSSEATFSSSVASSKQGPHQVAKKSTMSTQSLSAISFSSCSAEILWTSLLSALTTTLRPLDWTFDFCPGRTAWAGRNPLDALAGATARGQALRVQVKARACMESFDDSAIPTAERIIEEQRRK